MLICNYSKLHMKKIKLAFIILISPIILLILKSPTFAAPTITYRNYEVDIYINQDSTFLVEEKMDLTFDGYSNGVSRAILLDNPSCGSFNTNLTCGGFEFLVLESVELEGEKLEPDEYEKAIIEEEDGKKFFRIRKRLFSEETYVTDYKVTWGLRYKVYGGIQWRANFAGEQVPFFYWNTLPETSPAIEKAEVTIHFPGSVKYNPNSLDNYSSYNFDETYSIAQNKFTMRSTSVVGDNATVAYEFQEGEIKSTTRLYINNIYPNFGLKTLVNGEPIEALDDGLIEYMPQGEYDLEFTREGYISQSESVEIKNTDLIIDVSLEPEAWMRTLILMLQALTIIGLIGGIYYAYKDYKRINLISKDAIPVRTIVPQFKPPTGVEPYMLGSIIDETVDNKDITGTLIDLAYRGYIKIKQLSGNDYELTRTDKVDIELKKADTSNTVSNTSESVNTDKSNTNGNKNSDLNVQNLLIPGSDKHAIPDLINPSINKSSKPSSDDTADTNQTLKQKINQKDIPLNQVEKDLLNAIFAGETTRKILSLKSDTSFYGKMKGIIKSVYGEMVSKGFFIESPENVRIKYALKAFGFFFLGIFSLIFVSFFLTIFTGVWQVFTLLTYFLFAGVINMFMINKMPAKTELGSKVYGEILGFKMYLETAERFRLQNLEPEDFEKYLSFAIVLGVEKQWAEKFKDIYKSKPDWFEGDNFNPIYIGDFSRGFANSVAQSIRPVSTSSASGGGWKGGGGSFGGFSGGGGGGGRSGGW